MATEIPLLDVLDTLEKEANPGRWEVDPTEDIGLHHVGSVNPLAPICDCEDDEDAAFIAALRNAYPALSRNYRLMAEALEFYANGWVGRKAGAKARNALEAIKND